MRQDEFTEEVIKSLQKELGNGYNIEKKTLDGLNDTKKHSILVARAGSGVFPCINMGEYYNRHQKGEDFYSLFQTILSECKKISPIRTEDMEGFLCWDSIKSRIFAKLVNTGKNESMLSDVPNRQFLDLSIVYYVRINASSEEMQGSILVNIQHMKSWEADEETLFETAWKNTADANEVMFEDLNAVLARLLNQNIFAANRLENESRMYILGSQTGTNGAIQMCNRQMLHKAANAIGSDFWILPCSIHELILVPIYAIEGEAQELAEMVRNVNNMQLKPDEILSYHVYRYSRDTDILSIEA